MLHGTYSLDPNDEMSFPTLSKFYISYLWLFGLNFGVLSVTIKIANEEHSWRDSFFLFIFLPIKPLNIFII